MNIYEKMQIAKEVILKANLKKSGKNTFANYTYYELADLLPTIIKTCNELKLFTKVTFNDEFATLEIINIDETSETIVYTSPMKELNLKGANAVQALGGVETYQRRYLYMSAFDIIENDMFDGSDPARNVEVDKKDKKQSPVATKETLAAMNEAVTKYAELAGKDALALKDYFIKKAKVKSEKELTEVQARGIVESITKQINRNKQK